jgi:Domain of unknown function (DUF4258)
MNQPGARQKPQPWSPADATDSIRSLVREGKFTLALTNHASDQMKARDLISSDVLHVLRHGFVYEKPEPATRAGFYKYRV